MPNPVMAACVELLDELEAGGPLMREVAQGIARVDRDAACGPQGVTTGNVPGSP